MTDQELALIGLWALADWTRVARSIVTGKPGKPDQLGGSIPICHGFDFTASALAPATHWWADGKAIHSGVNPWSDPAELAHVCTWPAVLRWLRAFTDHERGELGRVHACFHAAHGFRPDEDAAAQGLFTGAATTAAARLYETRMRDGGWDAIERCQARFREIVAPHLQPSAVAHPKCPFGYGDRVEHHATAIYPAGMPWHRTYWAGTVLGSAGDRLLRGVKDDGGTWAENWSDLLPEGRRTRCLCHPPVFAAQPSLFDVAATA